MTYSESQIISDVRVWTGHNHNDQPLIDIDDLYTLTLDELIRSKIETAARQTLMEAPPMALAPGMPIRTQLQWSGLPGRGMAVLPLPDDFLRLLSIRLSDWDRPARIICDTDPACRWQAMPFTGIRGNPSRPVAVVTAYPSGRVAELYSSTAGPEVRVVMAQYVPVPRLRDGVLSLPEWLYHDFIGRIAQLTQP